MCFLQICFNIYSALIKENVYFYMSLFIHVPLLVQSAVFDSSFILQKK